MPSVLELNEKLDLSLSLVKDTDWLTENNLVIDSIIQLIPRYWNNWIYITVIKDSKSIHPNLDDYIIS
jgi:hypothetical protein